jgi:hypothetical protein
MHLGYSATSPTFVPFAAGRSANFIAPPAVDRADDAPGLLVTWHVHGPKPRLHLGSHNRNARLDPDFHLQSIHLPTLFSGHRSTQFALRFAHRVQLGLTNRSTRTLQPLPASSLMHPDFSSPPIVRLAAPPVNSDR